MREYIYFVHSLTAVASIGGQLFANQALSTTDVTVARVSEALYSIDIERWLTFQTVLQRCPIIQKYRDTCQPIRKDYFLSVGISEVIIQSEKIISEVITWGSLHLLSTHAGVCLADQRQSSSDGRVPEISTPPHQSSNQTGPGSCGACQRTALGPKRETARKCVSL